MNGRELLKFLQGLSETDLDKPVYLDYAYHAEPFLFEADVDEEHINLWVED